MREGNAMEFHVGDQVVHRAYGPGEIIQIEEKELDGLTSSYYVVQIRDLTLWVPVDQPEPHSLRALTPAEEFQHLFEILQSPGDPISDDRFKRKTDLIERLREGSLDAICQVIRDLSCRGTSKRLNEYDNQIMERARSFLLSEWEASLSVPRRDAEHELDGLLKVAR